uniref:site-specific DNA-methyltransferase n=1 Tax=Ndongobacter massiliensis TaxID=1871025 RepID=UPI0009303C9A|nr:DNA methyltransferase [Ndongobacter massiliensis]
MATINDLINQIKDEDLKRRIYAEVTKLSKQKKFGLVFEDHVPECTPLYEVPVRVGKKVAIRDQKISDIYLVESIEDGFATCFDKKNKIQTQLSLDNLVSIAEFGDAIYPYLQPIDFVSNASNSKLWHTLIEADNYHALQLLEYLYASKVDCIYIDPPYNKGARDWKYNNDYVDSTDAYRHSKWLSMMQKRLKLAKKLLNPKDSVLICTIDEKEYLHLGCLLEELFPGARIQMITSVINVRSVAREGEFGRVNEHIFVLFIGKSAPQPIELSPEWLVQKENTKTVRGKMHWTSLSRTDSTGFRSNSPGCFYPIYVDLDGRKIHSIGDSIPIDIDKSTVSDIPEGTIQVWPLRRSGSEGRWQVKSENARKLLAQGFLKCGPVKNDHAAIYYVKRGDRARTLSGEYGKWQLSENGIVIEESNAEHNNPRFVPGNSWNISSHDAGVNGTNLLIKIIQNRQFPFPKSLYAVHDIIRFFVTNKPNALILDFFAGSGTTLHAVNLLNSEDGGQRRCIMVTNNEVSDSEAKRLTKEGYHPGDTAWEDLGIARYVTWPRTVCSIEGHDVNGKPLKGTYLGSEREMAEGFKANAAFFKLGFLDKNAVALGRQFKELLPVLWMKAGCIGACPELAEESTPAMLVLPENGFAVLTDEKQFSAFLKQVNREPDIQTVFIITDSTSGYREMALQLKADTCYQLYRDYLDNFRINTGR